MPGAALKCDWCLPTCSSLLHAGLAVNAAHATTIITTMSAAAAIGAVWLRSNPVALH